MQSLGDELLHITTRIAGNTSTGTSVGTGFFFMHEQRIFIVTNKHVVQDLKSGSFSMLKAKVENNEKVPLLGNGINLPLNESNFIGHPDPNVDVTVMNASKLINDLEQSGNLLYWKNITSNEIPNIEIFEKFIGPMEDVIFIGYPSGLFDTKNMLPIIRKGMTASPCYYDFEGNRTFLIDASVFPGSSGSPVFIYYAGTYADKKGNAYAGNRLHFIGLVSKVYQRKEQGEIKVIDIPVAQTIVTEINQMIDLGIVYKADLVIEAIDNYLSIVNSKI